MNRISKVKKSQVIASLVEGNSIRATVRMTGVAKNTVVKLLAEIGAACEAYQKETLRNLPCKRVQCDEIWSFCYAKQKNVPAEKQGQFGYGDVWMWTALCADTKLICCWQIGTRGASSADALMHDLASRLANRIQKTTDGHRVYADAVESAFGPDIDYAMLIKVYGADREESEVRYKNMSSSIEPLELLNKWKSASTKLLLRTMGIGVRVSCVCNLRRISEHELTFGIEGIEESEFSLTANTFNSRLEAHGSFVDERIEGSPFSSHDARLTGPTVCVSLLEPNGDLRMRLFLSEVSPSDILTV